MWPILGDVIFTILRIYGYVLIAAAIMTWIPDVAQTQLAYVIRRLTDPYLNVFRRFIPSVNLGGVMFDMGYLVGVIIYFTILHEVVLRVILFSVGHRG